MKSRLILWSGLGAVGLFGAAGGAWILSLPPAHRYSFQVSGAVSF
jgi:hypothetical protein